MRKRIDRRGVLKFALRAAGAGLVPGLFSGNALSATPGFDFATFEVLPHEAVARWRDLQASDKFPIIVGTNRNLSFLKQPFEEGGAWEKREPATIVALADKLEHPSDLHELRRKETEAACTSIRERLADLNAKLPKIQNSDKYGKVTQLSDEETRKNMMAGCDTPDFDAKPDWPTERVDGETIDSMIPALFEAPHKTGYILIIPTADWTTVPAHLKWGGWNAHPHPEYHVAAMRSWHDRYGAKLAGMSHDTLIMSVDKRPKTREEAYALAQEQYLYCSDIVDQGLGSVTQLAAWLMVTGAWYFWWD